MFRLSFVLFLLGILTTPLAKAEKKTLSFTIKNTWDGKALASKDFVTLTLQDESNGDIMMKVDAPFYDDAPPLAPPHAPLIGLWNYEVVEAFFLNDDDQYLEVEIGPHAHHIVILLDGERNTIRHSLPLTVSTSIGDRRWTGQALIPSAYLPFKVTKFNAYAINGPEENRKYSALYPTDGTTAEPDFHNLRFFRPIDMSQLSKSHLNRPTSLLWQTAVKGIIPFVFDRTWKNVVSGLPPTVITLQGFKGGVEMNYTVPRNVPDKDFEELGIIFENNEGQELRIQVATDGSYVVQLMDNSELLEGRVLPLDSIVQEQDTSLTGSLLIPPSYFPKQVRRLNIYSKFGRGGNQIFLSLQPVVDDILKNNLVNIERDEHFIPIDIDFLLENNLDQTDLWNERLAIAEEKREAEPAPFLRPGFLRSLDSRVDTKINTFSDKDKEEDSKKPNKFKPQNDDISSIPISDFLLENLPESLFDTSETGTALDSDLGTTILPEEELVTVTDAPENVVQPFSISGQLDLALEPESSHLENLIHSLLTLSSRSNIVSTKDQESPQNTDGLVDPTESTQNKVTSLSRKPKYHPVCFKEGLVANPTRCQVFHECVIENGEWAMYNWRCVRGRRFDSVKVACIVGYC